MTTLLLLGPILRRMTLMMTSLALRFLFLPMVALLFLPIAVLTLTLVVETILSFLYRGDLTGTEELKNTNLRRGVR
jgi:hypothetical protein